MAYLARIEKHLKRLGIKYQIIDLGAEIFRVEDVVKAGVKAHEVVKTLLVKTPNNPENLKWDKNLRSFVNVPFVACAIRGAERLDFKKIKRLLGSGAKLAKPDEVREIVGVPVGAVCPILIGIPLYFDQKVMKLKNVNLGSGDLTKGLDVSLADLLHAVGEYQVVELV